MARKNDGSPELGVMTDGRAVHIVTMSKGGVGKTLCSWHLAQWLRSKGRKTDVIDLDPMSHSLAEYRGLGARTVDLLTGIDMTLNGPAVDQLSEDMLTGDGDWVLDNGAAGFVGLTRYLVDNEFSAMLGGYGGRLVVHAVLGGGSMSEQCLVGLGTLLDAFKDVRFVIWLNEYQKPFVVDGMRLEEMVGFKDNVTRIAGVVRLPSLSAHFLADFDRMREDRLTFDEALGSPKFLLMNRQRLTVIRRGVWDQLDKLGIVA